MKEPDRYLDQLAHNVIGTAIEVHRTLGPGFLESVYEKALVVELELRNIAFSQQQIIDVSYKGRPVGENRIDILVENCLIVESCRGFGTHPYCTGDFLSEGYWVFAWSPY